MMTRCYRDNINLKSSVYNQTGQSYIDQLSLHRSMCTHLRRVLLAKSVVDSRNPRYVRAIQRRSRPASRCRLRFLEGCPSDETIDRLAYDTEHHPSEIIRVQCRSKSSSNERSRSAERQQILHNDTHCHCMRAGAATKRPTTAANTIKSSLKSEKRSYEVHDYNRTHQQRHTKNLNYDKQQQYQQYCRCKSATGGRTCRSVSSRQYKHYGNNNDDDDDVYVNDGEEEDEEVKEEEEEEVRGGSRNTHRYTTPRGDKHQQLLLSSRSVKRRNIGLKEEGEEEEDEEEEKDDEATTAMMMLDEQSFRKLAERGEEEARYAKFVYDITQEIVQNGLYTDRELKEVFQKHLQRNSKRLNRRKMLYEIYQLKISLNMVDDSEEDEVEADMIFAEKFKSVVRVAKPPTPPKVLNENKIMEKLESFKQQDEQHVAGNRSASSTPAGRRSVVLIDANPEFLVTERDVLSTLADNQVEPEQIQQIYRNLFQRSKDMSLCEAVQVGSEVAYTHRLKQVDRSTSAISLNSAYGRERPHSILRKESTDFANKSLSPDTYHRYSYSKDKQSDALEKCATWKIGQCECGKECNKEVAETSEKEKKQSSEKKPDKEEKSRGKNVSSKKKKSLSNQKSVAKILENLKMQKPNRKKISPDTKSSSDSSEKSSNVQEVLALEEKQESMSRADSSEAQKSMRSEENEEIEEEIEFVMEEVPEKLSSKKSSRKSSIDENADKSDHEEKEQSSIKEKNTNDNKDDEEDAISIASEISDINSSDISIGSVTSEKASSATRTRVVAKSVHLTATNPDQVITTPRFASMKDYFESLAARNGEQKLYQISVASSDSTSTMSSLYNNPPATRAAVFRRDIAIDKVIRRRASSSVNRYKDSREERISEHSGDFCEANCRGAANVATGSINKNCSDNCKFEKTNCSNLRNSTDCLNKVNEKFRTGGGSASASSNL